MKPTILDCEFVCYLLLTGPKIVYYHVFPPHPDSIQLGVYFCNPNCDASWLQPLQNVHSGCVDLIYTILLLCIPTPP